MLVRVDPMLLYMVLTDASGIEMGGVGMQDQGSSPRTITFMSRAVKSTEQWYSAYERELAAIAYCFVYWGHYMEGCPGGVPMITNH